jgi:hypothetical protein
MVEPKRISSPAREARIAGAFYVLSFVSAISAEALFHGKVLRAVGFVPILCFAVATLILYRIFVPLSRSLSLLAALSNLAGLACEATEWHPHSVNAALVLHGIYCLLIGLLVFRSEFLPRLLSALMAIAGLAWFISISPQLADALHTYTQVAGFAGEGVFMLWLLAKGVNAANWHEQAGRRTAP